MSQQKEDRARQKFSDKMRQKSLAASKAKLAAKKTEIPTPETSEKKD
jgi:hypothetical protein